jgi:hypothetical protein
LNTKRLEDGNMEMKKYKIDKDMESRSIDNKYKIDKESSDNKTKLFVSLFENGKVTFDQLKDMM